MTSSSHPLRLTSTRIMLAPMPGFRAANAAAKSATVNASLRDNALMSGYRTAENSLREAQK